MASKKVFKVIIIGDSGVGKSSLLLRFVRKEFFESYKSTIGADFMSQEIKLDNASVTLQLWDTAGQEKFQSLGSQFFRGADACIIVFDLSNQASYQHLHSWWELFIKHASLKDPSLLLFTIIGNKSDLRAQVTKEQVEKWCDDHGGIRNYTCSAKDNIHVETVFTDIAKSLLERANSEKELYATPTVVIPTMQAPSAKQSSNPNKTGEQCSC